MTPKTAKPASIARIALAIFGVLSSATGRAQSGAPMGCESDLQKFCAAMPSQRDTLRCLALRRSELAPSCRDSLAELRLRIAGSAGHAPFAALGPMGFLPPQSTTLSYAGWAEPTTRASAVVEHSLRFQSPVFAGQTDVVSCGAGATSLHLGDSAPIPSTGQAVPTDLSALEVSTQFSRQLGNESMATGRVSFGSASDRPFANPSVASVSVSGDESFAHGPNSRWILGAAFSNNSPLLNNVPFPTVLYIYNGKQWSGVFGFPFDAIRWTPSESLTASLALMGPNVSAEIARGQIFNLQEFAGFTWGAQSFILQNRLNDRDRLFFVEKRAQIGVRLPIAKAVGAELAVGYAFDRGVAIQTNYLSSGSGSETTLDPSWFGQLALRAAF